MSTKKSIFVITKKELIVLRLVSQGLGNKQISGILMISERTVASHIGNLINKTGCKSRFALVIHFIKAGLLSPIGTDDRVKHLESQLTALKLERDDIDDQFRKFRQAIFRILHQADNLSNEQQDYHEP